MPSRSPAPSGDMARLRAAIVAAGRRLGARGLIAASEGNISALLADGRLLITPSGVRKDELAPADLLVVAARAGDAAPPSSNAARPSSDIAIHRAIYAARPDVQAVVHAHLPAAMALTLAGELPDPAVLPETALLLPRLPFVPFAAAGSEELAAAIAVALADGPAPLPGAVLLERHGAVAVGGGVRDATGASDETGASDGGAAIREALDRLELVEVLCRTWRDALLVKAAASGLGPRAILRPPSASPGMPAPRTRRRHQ
jgi:ribulose-5-phosphate 4-epimerase/fuculose-1-phosphate aldolase